MSYLYVDGCSFTWGQDLDNPPEENWGKLLGEKLGLPVLNIPIKDKVMMRYFVKYMNYYILIAGVYHLL